MIRVPNTPLYYPGFPPAARMRMKVILPDRNLDHAPRLIGAALDRAGDPAPAGASGPDAKGPPIKPPSSRQIVPPRKFAVEHATEGSDPVRPRMTRAAPGPATVIAYRALGPTLSPVDAAAQTGTPVSAQTAGQTSFCSKAHP